MNIKEQMKKLIQSKKYEEYLNLCIEDRISCLVAAQELFSMYYRNMTNNAWINYNSKAKEAKSNKDEELEVQILEEAVYANVDTPGTYERLAMIYSKKKEMEKAYEICQKWFSSNYWFIPNTAKTGLKIYKRMRKLEEKLK